MCPQSASGAAPRHQARAADRLRVSRRRAASRCGREGLTIRAMATAGENDRLRTLLETGIAISSELSIDAVLERIAAAAAQLTRARYAALGAIDRVGTGLERFVTSGVDE